MKLLLKLRYDGSGYAGYQAQPVTEDGRPSIQRTLTDAFSDALGYPVRVTGCSRTDAGVHALGFCCTVEPAAGSDADWLTIPVGRVHRVLSRKLPPDIAVIGEALTDDDFHPRYSVVGKRYRYRMYDTPYADPFLAHRAWHLRRPLPSDAAERMNAGGAYLIGRHDFTSFMAAGSKITDAHRTVTELSVKRAGELTELVISADGFLYNMVRIITGTLVDCAMGASEPEEIARILEACSRTAAGKTAPPDGLYLDEVRYDREILWSIE